MHFKQLSGSIDFEASFAKLRFKDLPALTSRMMLNDYIDKRALLKRSMVLWLVTALLASSGIFWAVALCILILLAFFAMERHQRYLKLLEDKENS